MKSSARAGAIALGALSLAACDVATPQKGGGGESWDLYRGFFDAGRVELVVAAGPAKVRAALLAEHLGLSTPLDVHLREPGEASGGGARILAGALADPALHDLARSCGVEGLADGGFRVLGREFRDPSACFVAAFADPARRARPLVLFVGNDAELLAAHMRSVPRPWKPSLRVYSDGELELACPLQPDGTPRAEQAIDYGERFRAYWSDTKVVEARGFEVRAKEVVEWNPWQRYLKDVFEASTKMSRWLGRSDERAVELYVYTAAEDMERCLGTVELSVVNPLRPRVHVLFDPGIPNDAGIGVARLRARTFGGFPAIEWMEDGACVAAAGAWWRKELVPWVGFLDAAGLIPSIPEIVDPRAGERFSEHVLMPARGFLFDVLATKLGDEKVRAVWAGAELDLEALQPVFEGALRAARKESKRMAERSDKVSKEIKTAEFRNGVTLLDERGELRSSYVTRAVGSSLDRLRELGGGPNSIALSVFACAEDPAGPLVTLSPHAVHGSASDVALANAAARARERLMRTTLVLEPLSSPGGTWADGGVLIRPAVQDAFWERATRIAVHYALLSELIKVEIFCLGANMGEAARTWPGDDGVAQEPMKKKLEAWRALIGTVRKVFSGGLTYASRFPADAWPIAFWEDLDYVGLQLYPRWAGAEERPSDADLERIVRHDLVQSVALGIRWNRPVLLIEVGFPSRSDSWQSPWIPSGGLDLDEQRRYFEVFADVLEGGFDNDSMLHGFYLWNWHVDPLAGGPEDGGFTLQAKPVESVLPRIFAD